MRADLTPRGSLRAEFEAVVCLWFAEDGSAGKRGKKGGKRGGQRALCSRAKLHLGLWSMDRLPRCPSWVMGFRLRSLMSITHWLWATPRRVLCNFPDEAIPANRGQISREGGAVSYPWCTQQLGSGGTSLGNLVKGTWGGHRGAWSAGVMGVQMSVPERLAMWVVQSSSSLCLIYEMPHYKLLKMFTFIAVTCFYWQNCYSVSI